LRRAPGRGLKARRHRTGTQNGLTVPRDGRKQITDRMRGSENHTPAIDDGPKTEIARHIKERIKECDGFVRLPNRCVKTWMRFLPSPPRAVLLWTIAETLGWHLLSTKDRRENPRKVQFGTSFSIAEVAEAAGLHRNSVAPAFDLLERLDLIKRENVRGPKSSFFVSLNLERLLAQSVCKSEIEDAQQLCNSMHSNCATSISNLHNPCANSPALNKEGKISFKGRGIEPPPSASRTMEEQPAAETDSAAATIPSNSKTDEQWEPILALRTWRSEPFFLDGKARGAIIESLASAGFTLAHFAAFVVRAGLPNRIENIAGYLITVAKEFPQRAAGFDFPKCLACFDSGLTGAAFCGCDIGKQAIAQENEVRPPIIRENPPRHRSKTDQAMEIFDELMVDNLERAERRGAAMVLPPVPAPEPPASCPDCGNSGWMDIERTQVCKRRECEAGYNACRETNVCNYCRGLLAADQPRCRICGGDGKFYRGTTKSTARVTSSFVGAREAAIRSALT
jgi:hypothetical protein